MVTWLNGSIEKGFVRDVTEVMCYFTFAELRRKFLVFRKAITALLTRIGSYLSKLQRKPSLQYDPDRLQGIR
jgi:hypothetical protein